jgi:oxygen-independent coproporphyrinogen-3 oxidase
VGHVEVGRDEVVRAVPAAAVPADAVVGLLDAPAGAYVHIPFCPWICPFCPYNKVRANAPLAARYGAALEREVEAVATAHARRFGVPLTSVYVGGGTPTLYPDLLGRVLELLPSSGERAVEVLPNHGTPEGFDRLAAMGFTAVSVGAQSFDDGVLHRLGRPHDAATARRAVGAAVGRFECVDVDLIVDVAVEGPEPDAVARPGTFLADVEACFDSRVDQVSTYPLMRFGYTPFGRSGHERRREHEVLAEVSALGRRMGYERRSVWTFNRRGSPSYTSITRRRFVGMGAGATSATGRDFLVNHFGVGTYCAAVEAGRLPMARRLHLGRWAGAAYEAFWQAYSGGVDAGVLAEAYGRDVAALARGTLAPARLAGLLRADDGELRLTPRGFDAYHDLERAVTYRFIEPLWAEMLAEHLAEGADTAPSCAPAAFWADPGSARRSPLWTLARWAMERPVAPGEPRRIGRAGTG